MATTEALDGFPGAPPARLTLGARRARRGRDRC